MVTLSRVLTIIAVIVVIINYQAIVKFMERAFKRVNVKEMKKDVALKHEVEQEFLSMAEKSAPKKGKKKSSKK